MMRVWKDGMKVSELSGNIRDSAKFRDSLWDWCFLNGCFGNTSIRVGDVDGIVERNGNLLFLEGKPPGFCVQSGQHRTWKALSGCGIWVLVLWGEADNPSKPNHKTPTQAMPWRPFADEPFPIGPASVESVRAWVSRWYAWANSDPFDLANVNTLRRH